MRNRLAVGLMSGTSMDGADAALIETDGQAHVRPLAFHCRAYEPAMRERLREAMAAARTMTEPTPSAALADTEARLTQAHAEAVEMLLEQAGVSHDRITACGFHGQTLVHRPKAGWTWQIGDGAALAERLSMTVVNEFRGADMAAGGQGAPLLPVYHRALARAVRSPGQPIAVLNLGGVGNMTWLGADQDDWLSLDTGPASALIDDWVRAVDGRHFDEGGALAASGRVDENALARLLDHPYFDEPPPKSLDRNDFSAAPVAGLSPADGAATLSAFTAAAVARALPQLPQPPQRILVCGGGRHNATIMAMLAQRLAIPVEPVEAVGWNGDALEAEAFAYFAIRHLDGRPITFPQTTGCREPTVGGVLHPAPSPAPRAMRA